MAEVFSITGGYMQLISTIFILITLLTKNINIEKKILNKLFNFNIKQKKIILSIQYQKKLNYLIHNEKGYINSFIPYKPKKQNKYPFIEFIQKIKQINSNNPKNNNIFISKINNNNFIPFSEHSSKNNNIKYKIKNNSEKIDIHKVEQNSKKNSEQNINKSKMIMLFKDEEINDYQISKIYRKENLKKERKINNDIKSNEIELITNLDFNLFDYFCGCAKIRNKVEHIELYKYGLSFYRNQMNIINIFNLIFLNKIMIMHYATKKNNNILNQIIEIPTKT